MKQKKLPALLLFILAVFWFSFSQQLPLFAQDDSDDSVSSSVDDKVQGLRDTVKEKVKEQIDEIKKDNKKGFAGTVDKIADQTLTIQTKDGPVVITTNKETEIINEEKQTIGLEDIKLEDYLIAMGYLNQEAVLAAKRLVLTPKPDQDNREVAAGIVTDISENGQLVTLKNDNKIKTYTILINSKTEINQKKDGQIEKSQFKNIVKGDFLIAIGTPEEENGKIITATAVCFTDDISPSPTEN